jgi:hypothetical protein
MDDSLVNSGWTWDEIWMILRISVDGTWMEYG